MYEMCAVKIDANSFGFTGHLYRNTYKTICVFYNNYTSRICLTDRFTLFQVLLQGFHVHCNRHSEVIRLHELLY